MRINWLRFLALVVAPCLTLLFLQEPAEVVQTAIVPVRMPLRVPFVFQTLVAGPNGSVFAQVFSELQGQQKFSIFEIAADGEVKRTYDLSSQASVRPADVRLSVDSSGSVYLFEIWPKDKDTGAAVHVFESGAFKEKVILSKSFRPRRMFVTPNRTWIFAGHTPPENGSTAREESRGVLYEFRSNGKFLREIELSADSNNDAKKGERFERTMDLDLSFLVGGSDGGFFLVRTGSSPLVLKFDASGLLVSKRQAPPKDGTAVVNAILDDQSRLVLDRTGYRVAGGEATNESRFLTLLDGSTLDALLEAPYPKRGGRLFAIRGGEFFFLKQKDSLTLEIHRARQF